MNFLTAAGFLLFTAGMSHGQENHPHILGPMPPDPVTVNRVDGPVTPASLAIWQMTSTNPEFLWRIIGASKTLTTPQLRTLSLDLLRIRRFYDHDSPQDWLMISAWFDREPAAAVRELMNIPDWEDRDDHIGDYDSDVEYIVWLFWKQLAQQDFPAALEIAGRLEGRESTRQFFGFVGHTDLSPRDSVQMINLVMEKVPHEAALNVATSFLDTLYGKRGPQAAREWITLLPEGKIREQASLTLQQMEKEGSPPSAKKKALPQPPVKDAALARLMSMDVRNHDDPFPFPLLREVQTLDVLDLQRFRQELRGGGTEPAGWLGWLLDMRVKEHDPGSTGVSTAPPPPFTNWNSYGLGRDTEDAGKIRAMLKLAAEGNYPEAMEAAAHLKLSPAAVHYNPNAFSEVLLIRALRDFPAGMAYAAAEKDEVRKRAAIFALDRAMHRLPCASVLPHLNPSLAGDLYLDPWFPFLPFEDREVGFRYFEKYQNILKGEAGRFLATAVRFEPVRSIAMARAGGSALTNTARGLARHWPDRIGELLKPEDGRNVWEAVARSLARYHPEKTIAVLKTQPFREAWEGAELEFSLQPSTRPELVQELKSNLPAEPASPETKEITDPFAEGR